MSRIVHLLAIATLTILLLSSTRAADRRQARLERIGSVVAEEIRVLPTFTAADTCMVRQDAGIAYRINGWVTGNELYKSYLDPSLSCPNPYPYTVTEINMPMIFDAATPLTVAVDVELADMTVPGCPFPGDMLTISSDWELQVPGAGLYDVWIPLDTPVTVTGPFFVGFFIANAIDTSVHAAVTCDTVPVTCVSYNIWETTTGYVDLVSNSYFNFPGRLVLYASGVTGGGAGSPQPEPRPAWVSPVKDSALVYLPGELWVVDTSGSNILDYVTFEYSSGGGWSIIGNDYDGSSPARNGVDQAVPGTGFSMVWDHTFLTEGTYSLRATVYDTLGRSASVTRTVVLEPTPPVPSISTPSPFDWFCPGAQFLLTCPDENVSYMDLKTRAIANNYTLNLLTLNQNVLGDVDGNAADGNPVSDGEFGDYYSGPAAATIALRLWYERGYTGILKNGATTMNSIQVAETLALLMGTRANLGTRDDRMYLGLQQYIRTHGNNMTVGYHRDPDYLALRSWTQDQERAVILGLGGSPGLWVAVNGFTGWANGSDYTMSISNPLTGQIQSVTWRDGIGQAELLLGGVWHPVEVMMSVVASNWTISRSTVGADFDGSNGWAMTWTPNGLVEGTKFYVVAGATDADGHQGSNSTLIEYNCSAQFAKGDFNNDAVTDMGDLYVLIQFIARGGPAPIGGAGRADCNCDTYINVADIVYFMNYLFGQTVTPPCY